VGNGGVTLRIGLYFVWHNIRLNFLSARLSYSRGQLSRATLQSNSGKWTNGICQI